MAYTHDSNRQQLRPCGCWYVVEARPGLAARQYMPQIDLAAHTTIMSITSKTVLKQTFMNSSKTQAIDQASYTFPLYDGVSVVGFECQVGTRIIRGLVKKKEQARADYTKAISCGETAGLLEQLPESSDVFTTRIGNIPAREKVVVEITYVGELKHDAEVDGVRFTIPNAIAPRYGTVSNSQADLPLDSCHATDNGHIKITVDVTVDEASFIRGIQSPSHPIGVTVGRTSAMAEDSTDPHRASATLSLGSAQLEKDFVLLILAKDQDIPRALLETHPKFPNQRALMATLVPRFNLPPSRPEIVFVVDRSGSMQGKIATVIVALNVFFKSLPVGVKVNICSFGSRFSFLWPRSKSYDKCSLEEALAHVSTFAADFGGTEMFEPVVETVKKRYKDMQLEVMLITDGQIWQQQELFDFINETASKEPVRFFSLGVGGSASHSLVEGIARAGNGFAQFVGENEKLDKKVVRMLKGALTPHIKDYTLEVKYEESITEGYKMVEKITEGLRVWVTDPDSKKEEMSQKPTISLFDPSRKDEDEKKTTWTQAGQDRYSHLPTIAPPKLLQAPSQIPPLYPFIRTSAYLLMPSEAWQKAPKSVVLRATSEHGPLELEIPVQDIGKGETIHRLAAKKAMTELEEGRGWIVEAKGDDGKRLRDRFDGRLEEIVQREAVRLGVHFQVGGKWCSFVAVQKNSGGVEQDEADFMPRTETLAEGEIDFLSVDASAGGRAVDSGGGMTGWQPQAIGSGGGMTPPAGGLARRYFPRRRSMKTCAVAVGSGGRMTPCFAADKTPCSHEPSIQPCAYVSGARSVASSECSPRDSPFGNMQQIFDSSQVRAKGSAWRRCLQAQSGYSSRELTCDVVPSPRSSLFGFSFGGLKHRRMKCRREVDVKADGIVGDKGMNAAQADAGRAEEFPWKSQRLEAPVDRMHALIALQGFDGSWEWSDELLHVVGLTKEAVTNLRGDRATMATVLAVAFLERRVPGEKETWELVVAKARGWLEMRSTEDVEVEMERVAALWV